jgi:3,4-dihydroxy 2-butanone 4-phosphate synthase/GTP cyclohydrolase II
MPSMAGFGLEVTGYLQPKEKKPAGQALKSS